MLSPVKVNVPVTFKEIVFKLPEANGLSCKQFLPALSDVPFLVRLVNVPLMDHSFGPARFKVPYILFPLVKVSVVPPTVLPFEVIVEDPADNVILAVTPMFHTVLEPEFQASVMVQAPKLIVLTLDAEESQNPIVCDSPELFETPSIDRCPKVENTLAVAS